MVKDVLVKERIEAGRTLTSLLDRAKLRVVASFWLFEPEANEWRLVISSPLVASQGPMVILRKVQSLLLEDDQLKGQLDLRDVYPEDPRSDLVQSFRSGLRTGKGLKEIRLTGSRVGGRFVEDAYVYRAA